MKLTVDRAELLAAAKRCALIAPTLSTVEALQCTLLETDSEQKRLYLTATNNEMSLRQSVKILDGSDMEISVAVKAALLSSMIGMLAGDTVTLAAEGESKLEVSCGSASYHVFVLDGAQYPKPEIPFPEDTIPVTGIPSMVRRCAFAAREDASAPLLRCIHLRFTKNGLVAVGSDGSCAVTAHGDKQSTGNIGFLVPADSLDKLARLCADRDVFSVGTTGKQLTFLRDGQIFSVRLMQGDYMDTDRIFGSLKNSFTVLSDADQLRDALSSVLSVAADNRVRLSFSGDTLHLECSGVHGTASTAVGVIALNGAPAGECWYMADRLNRCLRALGGSVMLGIANGGLLTVSTDEAKYMQIPVRPAAAKKVEKTKKTKKAA